MHALYCIVHCMEMKTLRFQFCTCTCISVSNKTYMYVTLDNFSYRFLFLYFTKKERRTPLDPLSRTCVYTPDHFSVLLLFYLCIGVAFFYPGSLRSYYCPGRGRSHTIQTVCNHRASNVLGPSSQRKHSRT